MVLLLFCFGKVYNLFPEKSNRKMKKSGKKSKKVCISAEMVYVFCVFLPKNRKVNSR